MSDIDLDAIERRADSLVASHAGLLSELVAMRTRHKLTQADVAERMGVSQPTVAAFERYDANPTLSTIRRYALAVEARLVETVVDDCCDAGSITMFEAIVTGTTTPRFGRTRRLPAPDQTVWSTTSTGVVPQYV